MLLAVQLLTWQTLQSNLLLYSLYYAKAQSNALAGPIYTPVNSPDFVGKFPISRISPDHPISTKNLPIAYHDLAQDFLNSKINQFFEKLINFVREPFFLKRKEYTSAPASTDFIFFKSFDLKINVWSCCL